MDKLAYHYKPGTNQLDYVHDMVPAGNYDADIDAQTAGNYQYDSIGNLVKNVADSITSISWTVYGKISRIVKEDGTDILYTYGTDGNRISKTVIKPGSTDTARTWYVGDASGNVMSVYESGRPSINQGHLTQSELHIYGSSRLGLLRRSVNMDTVCNAADTTMPLLGTGLNLNFNRGNKLFELSNHLGNVLVTLSDKKLGVSSNNTTIDYFNPQIVSAQDYYPLGMLQPGRSYNAGGYRYGFNGKENDNEVKGDNNQLDFGARVYDSRLGRFLSVDPLIHNIPFYSPFLFAGDKPIVAMDHEGNVEIIVHHKIYSADGKTVVRTYTNRFIIETVEDLRGINRDPINVEVVERMTKISYQIGGGTVSFDVPKAQFAKMSGGESYEDRNWSGWEGKMSKSVYKAMKKFWPPAKLNDAWVNEDGLRDPVNNELRWEGQRWTQTGESILEMITWGRAPFKEGGLQKLLESQVKRAYDWISWCAGVQKGLHWVPVILLLLLPA